MRKTTQLIELADESSQTFTVDIQASKNSTDRGLARERAEYREAYLSLDRESSARKRENENENKTSREVAHVEVHFEGSGSEPDQPQTK